MLQILIHPRRIAASLLTSMGLLMLPVISIAQDAPISAILTFRPTCSLADQRNCSNFPVADPQSLKTPLLNVGDTLDLEIVALNPTQANVQKIRSWISYDATILEGLAISINPQFPIITPGESDFSAAQGYAKIEARTEGENTVSGDVFPIARLTFKIKSKPRGERTIISFYDVGGLQGHTGVFTNVGTPRNIVVTNLGSLFVNIQGLDQAGSSSVASSIARQSSSRSSSNGQDRSAFVLLQVQNLRVTTDGTAAYLAWDHLRSSDLKGYNVYYGTQKGRYLQRRSIDQDSDSIAIRGLPTNITYYFATRGVNSQNEESAFSQEVSVKIGDPSTSTSPLLLTNRDPGPGGRNPLDQPKRQTPTDIVPGESGSSSNIALFLIAAAVIGTLFAFRRQFSAAPHQA